MKIEHIALWVKDLEIIRLFYEKHFHAKSNKMYRNSQKGFSSYFLSFDTSTRLEIMKMDSENYATKDKEESLLGLAHFAISVGSARNVDDLTMRLKENGYQILNAPRKTGDGYYESIISDPEGNSIEITI